MQHGRHVIDELWIVGLLALHRHLQNEHCVGWIASVGHTVATPDVLDGDGRQPQRGMLEAHPRLLSGVSSITVADINGHGGCATRSQNMLYVSTGSASWPRNSFLTQSLHFVVQRGPARQTPVHSMPTSRYMNDFEEIKFLGMGGFANVVKVCAAPNVNSKRCEMANGACKTKRPASKLLLLLRASGCITTGPQST